MRHFLELQYMGTRYRGWQRQIKVNSIQEKIEDALSKILKRKIAIRGCGRTDAGVHASQFFAHFYLEEALDFDLIERLNYILPEDINIKKLFPVGSKLNAQLSAISRTYNYKIHNQKNPFINQLSSYYPIRENQLPILIELAALVKTGKNFKAFCKQPNLYDHTHCQIYASEFYPGMEKGNFIYTIKADRFLRGMVRLIMGTMLEVAFGKMSIIQFKSCLFEQNKLPFYRAAYPQGLYLAEVEYPSFPK